MNTLKKQLSAESLRDKFIDLVLEDILSTNADAGWHMPNIVQRLIDFAGDLPPPSGDDKADDKMIREIRYLKNPHALLKTAKRLMNQLPDLQRIILVMSARYEGTFNMDKGKKFTDKDIAAQLDLSVSKYRYQRDQGRKHLLDMVEALIDEQTSEA